MAGVIVGGMSILYNIGIYAGLDWQYYLANASLHGSFTAFAALTAQFMYYDLSGYEGDAAE